MDLSDNSVSTLAGTGCEEWKDDIIGLSARFVSPASVILSSDSAILYVGVSSGPRASCVGALG